MFDSVPQGGISAAIYACQSSFPIQSKSLHKQEKSGRVQKAKFSPEEDALLTEIVTKHGSKDWVNIAALMKTRNPRQCRERWNNYLNPVLRTDPFTPEEDILLARKFQEYGPHWNKISKFFYNRSDNSLRNRWMMIERHRAKNKNGPVPSHPLKRRVEQQRVVMPVAKEFIMPEIKAFDNSFDILDVPTMSLDGFEMGFNDFEYSFF